MAFKSQANTLAYKPILVFKSQVNTQAFKFKLAFKGVIFTIGVPKLSGVWADTPPILAIENSIFEFESNDIFKLRPIYIICMCWYINKIIDFNNKDF